MRVIGLTGGIATGKSTVSALLTDTAVVPVIDADAIARKIVEPGTPGLRRVVNVFGNHVLAPDGTLDRPRLASLIFSDPDARRKLDKATHPYIRLEMLRQLLYHFLMLNRCVVLDTPLLFEAGIHKWVHLIVVVYTTPSVQRMRLVGRDLITDSAAQQRIDAQMPIDEKKALADVVIDNSGKLADTKEIIAEFIKTGLFPPFWSTVAVWVALFWPAAVVYAGLTTIHWLQL